MLLTEDTDLWVPMSDIEDYFYECGVPDALSSYVCLPNVPGWLLREIDEENRFVALHGLELVAPRFHVLPMGWKWSFFFARLVHTQQLLQSVPQLAGCILEDCAPTPLVEKESFVALSYCDNLAMAGVNPAVVNQMRETMTNHLEGLGFRVHEEGEAVLWAESLGFAIDGLAGRVGPSRKRAWRLRLAC